MLHALHFPCFHIFWPALPPLGPYALSHFHSTLSSSGRIWSFTPILRLLEGIIVSLSFVPGRSTLPHSPFFIIPFCRIRTIMRWFLAQILSFSWRPPCQLIGKGGSKVMSKWKGKLSSDLVREGCLNADHFNTMTCIYTLSLWSLLFFLPTTSKYKPTPRLQPPLPLPRCTSF